MLPDTILFSSTEPAGISIRSPWFAMMITVPCLHMKQHEEERKINEDKIRLDFLLIFFSLFLVHLHDNYPQWNASTECYIARHSQMIQFDDVRNICESVIVKMNRLVDPGSKNNINDERNARTYLDKNCLTLLKWLSPSLTNGVVGNIRCGDITNEPPLRLYKFDMTNNKSEVFLTGKNRDRGTFTPMAPSKHFIAAPTAVSNWITRNPLSNVLLFTMISIFNFLAFNTLSMDFNEAHKLFVLKNLNVFTDLKSSMCSFGTWAISNRRSLFSYWINVPPFTSARVLSVTSITNSIGLPDFSPSNLLRIFKSTVAPKLSILLKKQYSRPSAMNWRNKPEFWKDS